jgi:hypothetical protein
MSKRLTTVVYSLAFAGLIYSVSSLAVLPVRALVPVCSCSASSECNAGAICATDCTKSGGGGNMKGVCGVP